MAVSNWLWVMTAFGYEHLLSRLTRFRRMTSSRDEAVRLRFIVFQSICFIQFQPLSSALKKKKPITVEGDDRVTKSPTTLHICVSFAFF